MTELQKKKLQTQIRNPEYLAFAIHSLADFLAEQLTKKDNVKGFLLNMGGKHAANHRGKRIQRQSGFSA